MSRAPRKYEPGKGGKRIVVELDEDQFKSLSKDIEKIEDHLKKELGTSSIKLAVITSVKHYARHIERGDFEK